MVSSLSLGKGGLEYTVNRPFKVDDAFYAGKTFLYNASNLVVYFSLEKVTWQLARIRGRCKGTAASGGAGRGCPVPNGISRLEDNGLNSIVNCWNK